MAVELDIAGNFAKGQQATLQRRRARQVERANDYALAREDEALQGRRDNIRQQEEVYGLDPMEFAPFNTNKDPWLERLFNWWKQKRANRVMPSNMLPEQTESVGDEMSQFGQGPPDPMTGGTASSEPAQTYPMGERAIPTFADGGDVASEDEMIRRRAAANRARSPASVASRTETAIPRRPGALSRLANSRVGKAVGKVGRGGALVAGASAIAPQLDENYDERLEQRFGFAPPGPEDADPSLGGFAKFFGKRLLGYASDLGNSMTLGVAGNAYRDNQEQPAAPPQRGAIPTSQAQQGIPKTPDEAIAQQAIQQGMQMAEEAQAQSAPPGDIDFSKTDFDARDIPNMPVKDWVDYRGRMVRNLMAQGATPVEAHAQVTKLQQQGFVDYAQQALMHLQAGNPKAAATALRAAYQYFPNGADVRLGAQQGKDGQPVIVGQGFDENTNKPSGPPMVLNSERLATMIENFSNPDAFRAWTKDWRDDRFKRQNYAEVTKPAAEAQAQYQGRVGRAAEANAQANLMEAEAKQRAAGATGARKQVDLDRANAAFMDAVELLGIDDQGQADRLMSTMSQIYARSNWQYPQVIEFVRRAQQDGRLEEVMQALGLGDQGGETP